jgi:hypothetical protein
MLFSMKFRIKDAALFYNHVIYNILLKNEDIP